MGGELKACPFCGLAPSRAAKSYGTPIVCCGNAHCTLGASDADWYEIDDWNQRPIEDAATARAEAAEQLADLYGRFVQECGFLADIEVYWPGDLPSISERLGALRARAEAAEQRAEALAAEVARLRADRAVVTTLAIMALGPETHDVLLCSPVPLLGALRPECLAALPSGAQSDEVAAYVRAMCGRMLAEAQPAEVPNG